MAVVQQDPTVMKAASELFGVQIDPDVRFDAATPLKKVAAQLNGASVDFGAEDAEFGGFLGRVLNKVTPKRARGGRDLSKMKLKVDVKASAKGLAKGVGTAAAVASFVVPGAGPLVGGSALAAMKAADKLLGDPNVKGAAQLVSNTKALAALGNKPARRGAAVLGAVAQIRQQKGVVAGQAVIKPVGAAKPAPVNTKPYTQVVPRTTVKALAVKAAATSTKKTFWQKVKDLFS